MVFAESFQFDEVVAVKVDDRQEQTTVVAVLVGGALTSVCGSVAQISQP